TNPLQYYYDGELVNFPTNYVVSSLYQNSDTLDGVGTLDTLRWSAPFQLNYRYRNLAPSLTGLLNGGVGIEPDYLLNGEIDGESLHLNDPAAYYFSYTNFDNSGLLSQSDVPFAVPYLLPADIGVYDSGINFSLPNNVTNYFGLRLLSVLAVHSDTNGLHADVIDPTHPLNHGTNIYYFYPQFDQPQLQTVGVFFNRTGDEMGNDPAPGMIGFSPTNVQRYLVFGSPQPYDEPVELSAFSKQIIVNGDTNKPVFISQYLDKAYKVDTNGNITSEE